MSVRDDLLAKIADEVKAEMLHCFLLRTYGNKFNTVDVVGKDFQTQTELVLKEFLGQEPAPYFAFGPCHHLFRFRSEGARVTVSPELVDELQFSNLLSADREGELGVYLMDHGAEKDGLRRLSELWSVEYGSICLAIFNRLKKLSEMVREEAVEVAPQAVVPPQAKVDEPAWSDLVAATGDSYFELGDILAADDQVVQKAPSKEVVRRYCLKTLRERGGWVTGCELGKVLKDEFQVLDYREYGCSNLTEFVKTLEPDVECERDNRGFPHFHWREPVGLAATAGVPVSNAEKSRELLLPTRESVIQVLVSHLQAVEDWMTEEKLLESLEAKFRKPIFPLDGCSTFVELAEMLPQVEVTSGARGVHYFKFRVEELPSAAATPIPLQPTLPSQPPISPPVEVELDSNLTVKELCERLVAVAESVPEVAEERAFLACLSHVAVACHFNYAPRDLVRFHTAAKTGALTVLGGDPGTGKSSLAEIYARALLGPDFRTSGEGGASFLQISVNPAWAEPADLLGFEGLTNGFHEARSGLCSFLRRAMAAQGSGVRMCCLEEINLACVEHYFSDFMQILSRTDNRVVPGCDRAGFPAEKPESAPLLVGDNVRFLGTCNFDETVKPMSQRFYDRCSYLELEPPVLGGFPKEVPCIDGNVFKQYCGKVVGASMYAGWVEPRADVLPEVDRLFALLQKALKPLGLRSSPRGSAEIRKYVCARPPALDASEGTLGVLQLHALDEAVAQRIVSKYRPEPYRQSETKELRTFFENAGFTVSQTLMETLDRRYEIPEL